MCVVTARRDSHSRTLWSGCEEQALKDPERQWLDAIASGELDEHLVAIADAVHARRELLQTVRSATAIAQVCVGDTVVLAVNVRPRYLAHELPVITELDEHRVTLRLERPVGRFRDGKLRCPPLGRRTCAFPPARLGGGCLAEVCVVQADGHFFG